MLFQLTPPHPGFGILPLVSFVPTVGFFFIFVKKTIATHQRVFKYLAAMTGAYLFSLFFTMGSHFALDQEFAEFSFIIAKTFDIITIIFLVSILELFEQNQVISFRQTILAILGSLAIGAMVSSPDLIVSQSEGLFWVTLERATVISILQIIFYGTGGLVLTIILVRSKKAARSSEQKHLISLVIIGIILMQLIGSFTPITVGGFEIPVDITPALLIIGFFQNIGVIIISYAFSRASKYPWLLQRQRNHLLFVFSEDGITLYQKIFRDDISEGDVVLLTGGFSAISSMFKETTKSEKSLTAILFEDLELRVVRRDLFIVALLTEYTSQATETALKRFCVDFEQKFKIPLAEFKGNIGQFRGADEIVENFFA